MGVHVLIQKEKKKLRALAEKIDNIPLNFVDGNGKLDLDKVNRALARYQGIMP